LKNYPERVQLWQSAVVGGREAWPGKRQSAIWHSAWRAGITALPCLAATTAAALVLARGGRLGAAATLIAVLGGIAGLHLMWVAYRDDRDRC
jgi:ABC-type spermidine/putrescine transport system permease subunit I